MPVTFNPLTITLLFLALNSSAFGAEDADDAPRIDIPDIGRVGGDPGGADAGGLAIPTVGIIRPEAEVVHRPEIPEEHLKSILKHEFQHKTSTLPAEKKTAPPIPGSQSSKPEPDQKLKIRKNGKNIEIYEDEE